MKIKECKKNLREKKIDCMLLSNMRSEITNWNYFYFTQTSCLGFLMIKANGKDKLFVPELDFHRARKESAVEVYPIQSGFINVLTKELINSKRIGLDYSSTTLQNLAFMKKAGKGKKFFNISDIIAKLKLQKTSAEISLIRKSCSITDFIFSSCLDMLKMKKILTDSDLYAFILNEIYKKGCIPSFDPIIASGKNASLPHYVPSRKRLSKGFLLFDFGVRYKGYCSDMSRTIYLGKPSKKEIDIYYNLLDVQSDAIKMVKSGLRVAKLDLFCSSRLGGYPHSLGHGVGVEIHESPSISQKSNEILKEGMVITIEPGIYSIDKYGLRIEDDVLVTRDGYEILTKSKKELISIE